MKDKVIMVCYACEPNGATEHGLGWQWVIRTCKYKDVILVTRPGRKGLAEECAKNGIELVEVAVPSVRRKLTQRLGDIGIWMRIYSWAGKVNKEIKQIVDKESIGYVHLVTFHSIWMPNIFKGIRTKKIWGPVSGGEYVPSSYIESVGPEAGKEKLRNWVNKWSNKNLGKKVKSCDLVVCGNSQTKTLVENHGAKKTVLILPNAVKNKSRDVGVRAYQGGCLNFAFVGSCQGRRSLVLLFEALSEMEAFDWKVEVAGTGQALDFWKEKCSELGITEKVEFHGWVNKETVDEIYQRAHIFAFTTIRDGGGSGMLEALERGVPVLALDWGGPADVLYDTGAGKLISAESPEKSIAEIKQWIEELRSDPATYSSLAIGASKFDFGPFLWSSKIDQLMASVDEAS